MKMKAAVIILNWNGERLLQEFLPSVIANTNPRLASIVVADNASTDGSVALLREHFPEVELLLLDENYGFAGGYNRAIAAREEEVVVLLNSDVEVAAGWLEPLLAALEADRRLVAVQPKIRSGVSWVSLSVTKGNTTMCVKFSGAVGRHCAFAGRTIWQPEGWMNAFLPIWKKSTFVGASVIGAEF